MVILQFNKLIRNKWVWGVFALVVSFAFLAPDEWFRDDNTRRNDNSPLTQLSVEYSPQLEKDAQDMLRCFPEGPVVTDPRNRDSSIVGDDAYAAYAALATFEDAGIRVSDREVGTRVREMILDPLGGDEKKYKAQIASMYGADISRYEELLRKSIAMQEGVSIYLGSSLWVSPMEMEQLRHDLTDRFTIRVARFKQTKEEADAIKVDDKGLEKWFADNKDRLHIPARIKLRAVEFNAADTNLVASIVVTDEDIKSRYEFDKASLYTSADTNGVETVTPLADVSEKIRKTLIEEKFMEERGNALWQRVSDEIAVLEQDAEVDRPSLVETVAKENGLKTFETDWIATSSISGIVPGFARIASSVFYGVDADLQPGDETAADQISKLDPKTAYRQTVLTAKKRNRLWLVEAIAMSEEHDATFEEAKKNIADPALRDARDEAFKAAVAKIVEKGVAAVLATTNVAEAVTFSPSDEKMPEFPNAQRAIAAAAELNAGEMSELISTGIGSGFIVVCQERTNGELANIFSDDRQSLIRILTMKMGDVRERRKEFLKANLERLGYKGIGE